MIYMNKKKELKNQDKMDPIPIIIKYE